MNFYTSANTKINNASAVALGCFDGVHIGHSKIISTMVRIAKESALTSVVWSFQAPPKSILSEQMGAQITITPKAEKRKLISVLSVDTLICVPFNEKISKLSPCDFFENILIKNLNAKHIFCGFNYRFGYEGKGDSSLLMTLCHEFGIKLTIIDEIMIDGVTVSSSAIRSYLLNGDLDMAEKMLGRPHFLRQKVKDGQHLGRTLGFPTINQEVPKDKITVKNGVYLTRVNLGKITKYGITNIGIRPTVNGIEPVCETHIIDFSENLYGKYITVEFIKFIRDEKKFSSIDELSSQVHSDIDYAKKIISTNQ